MSDSTGRKPQHGVLDQTLATIIDEMRDRPRLPTGWLIEGMIPRCGAVLRMPATSYAGLEELLDLAVKVASPGPCAGSAPATVFGKAVHHRGRVAILSAQYDRDEIHRRTREMHPTLPREVAGRIHPRTYCDMLAEGRQEPVPILFDWREGGWYLSPTPALHALQDELQAIDNLALVVLHPMWSYVANAPCSRSDSESCSVFEQKLLRRLSHLAHFLGCAVVGYHE
jgi:hypothetical protein